MPPRQFDIQTLKDGRRWGIAWDEKPRCVNGGHLIKPKHAKHFVPDTLVTCVFRPGHGTTECGVQQWGILFTLGGSAKIQGTGERALIMVEVTRELIERRKREPMIELEWMTLLGLTLPGVDVDLLGAGQNDAFCAICGRTFARHTLANHEFTPTEDV